MFCNDLPELCLKQILYVQVELTCYASFMHSIVILKLVVINIYSTLFNRAYMTLCQCL